MYMADYFIERPNFYREAESILAKTHYNMLVPFMASPRRSKKQKGLRTEFGAVLLLEVRGEST
jgi:hypothetical protein